MPKPGPLTRVLASGRTKPQFSFSIRVPSSRVVRDPRSCVPPHAPMAWSQLARIAVLVCALASANAFAPVSSRLSLATTSSRTALVMVAKTAEDKALLASSKKVDRHLRATLAGDTVSPNTVSPNTVFTGSCRW